MWGGLVLPVRSGTRSRPAIRPGPGPDRCSPIRPGPRPDRRSPVRAGTTTDRRSGPSCSSSENGARGAARYFLEASTSPSIHTWSSGLVDQSLANWALPESVSGWFSICLRTLYGTVETSAPT